MVALGEGGTTTGAGEPDFRLFGPGFINGSFGKVKMGDNEGESVSFRRLLGPPRDVILAILAGGGLTKGLGGLRLLLGPGLAVFFVALVGDGGGFVLGILELLRVETGVISGRSFPLAGFVGFAGFAAAFFPFFPMIFLANGSSSLDTVPLSISGVKSTKEEELLPDRVLPLDLDEGGDREGEGLHRRFIPGVDLRDREVLCGVLESCEILPVLAGGGLLRELRPPGGVGKAQSGDGLGAATRLRPFLVGVGSEMGASTNADALRLRPLAGFSTESGSITDKGSTMRMSGEGDFRRDLPRDERDVLGEGVGTSSKSPMSKGSRS